jgi:hypothetical protein
VAAGSIAVASMVVAHGGISPPCRRHAPPVAADPRRSRCTASRRGPRFRWSRCSLSAATYAPPASSPSIERGFVVFVSYHQQLFSFNHRLMDLGRRKG